MMTNFKARMEEWISVRFGEIDAKRATIAKTLKPGATVLVARQSFPPPTMVENVRVDHAPGKGN